VPNGAIVADGYNLVIGGLAVSFQRYPEGTLQGADEAPRSYGALPVELSAPTSAFLPAREGEGIWLGFMPRDVAECSVAVGWLGGGQADDLPRPWSAVVAKLEIVHGLRSPQGAFCPFIPFPVARNIIPCPGVVISVRGRQDIEVRFDSVADFEAKAGKPAPRPMSPDDSYGGWLLP